MNGRALDEGWPVNLLQVAISFELFVDLDIDLKILELELRALELNYLYFVVVADLEIDAY